MIPLPPPRVIACDVDGTLIAPDGTTPNLALVAWLRARRAEGFTLHLWSMRGEAHARAAAQLAGAEDLFAHITSKPGFIVDDRGWEWIRGTRTVRSLTAPL